MGSGEASNKKKGKRETNEAKWSLITLAHRAHIAVELGSMLGMVLKKAISLNDFHTLLETFGKTAF